MPSPSLAACRTAMSPRRWARRARSASTAFSAPTATAAAISSWPCWPAASSTRFPSSPPTLSPATASSSLGEALGLGAVADAELAAALDWLLERQAAIETALAKRHLQNGTLVLYDVSSSDLEGRCCPLAQSGYNRDGKKGMLQIVYGLLCAPDGCPVAIEVFDGNTADPMTLAPQIDKLNHRFGLEHVVLVGDRGLITEARISADIKSAGLDWITALRAPAIKD